jgi:hypothetical protein
MSIKAVAIVTHVQTDVDRVKFSANVSFAPFVPSYPGDVTLFIDEIDPNLGDHEIIETIQDAVKSSMEGNGVIFAASDRVLVIP